MKSVALSALIVTILLVPGLAHAGKIKHVIPDDDTPACKNANRIMTPVEATKDKIDRVPANPKLCKVIRSELRHLEGYASEIETHAWSTISKGPEHEGFEASMDLASGLRIFQKRGEAFCDFVDKNPPREKVKEALAKLQHTYFWRVEYHGHSVHSYSCVRWDGPPKAVYTKPVEKQVPDFVLHPKPHPKKIAGHAK